MIFGVRRRSTPWDPSDDEPLTLRHVNARLSHEGLRVIRVERQNRPYDSPQDRRQSYVLVRLDGREIDPARIFGRLSDVALALLPNFSTSLTLKGTPTKAARRGEPSREIPVHEAREDLW